MRFQDVLRNIAESLNVSFVFEDWTQANAVMDNTPLPAIIYVLPSSGSLDMSKGFIKDSQNGMLAFLDTVQMYGDGVDNDTVVDRMKDLAMKFFIALNLTGCFEIIGGNLPYKSVYDRLDSNVSGITFELTLKEKIGVCERNV